MASGSGGSTCTFERQTEPGPLDAKLVRDWEMHGNAKNDEHPKEMGLTLQSDEIIGIGR